MSLKILNNDGTYRDFYSELPETQAGGGNGQEQKTDVFHPTPGQTVFTLSEQPGEGVSVKMEVNGCGVDSFNWDGFTEVTFTGTNYTLGPSDFVKFKY